MLDVGKADDSETKSSDVAPCARLWQCDEEMVEAPGEQSSIARGAVGRAAQTSLCCALRDITIWQACYKRSHAG